MSQNNKMLQNKKSKPNSELHLINEIVEKKDELIPTMNNLINNNFSEKWSVILKNHITYSEIIEEYIKNLIDAKLKIDKCVTLLENAINTNKSNSNSNLNSNSNSNSNSNDTTRSQILELNMTGKKIGKILDTIYTMTFDEKSCIATFHIELQNISNKIKIIDKTKRYVLLYMEYENGIKVCLNIKFDLDSINETTQIVTGSYTSTRV